VILQEIAVEYDDDGLLCRGIAVRERSSVKRLPGVVLFPDARGIGDTARRSARRLAEHGFIVLVADLYGAGAYTAELEQAQARMNALRSDLTRWRARAAAALEAVARLPVVAPEKLAAIGYCFGGSTALELGRSGASLAALVSFHGGLASPQPQDAANIRARVLACHGAADPLVPPAQVAEFVTHMSAAQADWQLHAYAGVVHGFTNPETDAAGIPALAYNAAADARSWQAMITLLQQVFAN
jgi:dienelactone hydrolase